MAKLCVEGLQPPSSTFFAFASTVRDVCGEAVVVNPESPPFSAFSACPERRRRASLR
jgi:hypothetical protein